MIKDIFFVLMVISATLYAHNHKVEIVSLIEVMEDKMCYGDMICDDKTCVIKEEE